MPADNERKVIMVTRKTRLEDRLLELMEERETLDGRLVPAREAADAARAAFEELTRDSADEGTRQRIEAALSDRLAAYKRPRSYHFLEQLPRTATGKLVRDKAALHAARSA